MAIIQGTEGNDILVGTTDNDTIYDNAGDDVAFGDNGNDTLEGGDGKDTLSGGDGNDYLQGGYDDSDDTVFGDDGNDTIFDSGGGKNLLYGGSGRDTIYGGSDRDIQDGGSGNDSLYGIGGNDLLYGGSGHDSLYGSDENDALYGGAGNDFLVGGDEGFANGTYLSAFSNQIDTLTGGAGRDTFGGLFYDDGDPLTAGTTSYTLIKDFNTQEDFIQLSGAKSNYYLAASPNGLPEGTAIFFNKPGNEPDELMAIVEGVSGLTLNSSYFTTTGNDFFEGTNGADRFNSGTGDDSLKGNDGADTLYGANGNDYFIGGTGNDSLLGGDGNDTFLGGEGFDGGGSFGVGEIDRFTGGAGRDIFSLEDDIVIPRGETLGRIFYDDGNTATAGTNDYALIVDFNRSDDFIRLLGTSANYRLSSTSGSLPTGTGIYINKPNEPDELIAIIQGVSSSSLSLTSSYFSYVVTDSNPFG